MSSRATLPVPCRFCRSWSGGLSRDLVRAARSCVTHTNRGARAVSVADLVHQIVRRDVTEMLDAVIRSDRERLADTVEVLLALRRVHDTSASPHTALGPRSYSSGRGIAVTGGLPRHRRHHQRVLFDPARLRMLGRRNQERRILARSRPLADAKAALDIHPSEACTAPELVAVVVTCGLGWTVGLGQDRGLCLFVSCI